MNRINRLLGIVAISGLMPVITQAENPDYPSSWPFKQIVVPYTTNGTGAMLEGTLREGNNTPTPRDQDWFYFRNDHHFTSMKITITPMGIDGAQHINWEIGGGPSGTIGSSATMQMVFPAHGLDVYFGVFDDNSLTSASSSGRYKVEVVGMGGTDPAVAAIAKNNQINAVSNSYGRSNSNYKKWKKKYKKLKKDKKKRKTKSGKKKLKKYKKKYKKYKKQRDSYRRQLAALYAS